MGAEPTLQLGDTGWLQALLDEAVEGVPRPPFTKRKVPRRPVHDADASLHDAIWSSGVMLGALARETPGPVQGRTHADGAFVQTLRFSLREAALVTVERQPRLDEAQLRWRLGAVLGAMVDEFGASSVLDEAIETGELPRVDEVRLTGVIGSHLVRRAYLQGNPRDGFPLHAAVMELEARSLVRLATAKAQWGRPLRPRVAGYGRHLSQSMALFTELVAAVFASTEAPDASASPEWLRIASRQIRALAIAPSHRRAVTERLREPRRPVQLLRGVPRRLQEIQLEHLVLAAVLSNRWNETSRALVVEAVEAIGGSAEDTDCMAARCAALGIEHKDSALGLTDPGRETVMSVTLNAALDSMHGAASAMAREVRATGELGTLLGRMAKGDDLSAAEKRKMREQLIDLAKAVPALAVFAAPGGTLLLPLALKLLPAEMLPAAFQPRPAPRVQPAFESKPDAA